MIANYQINIKNFSVTSSTLNIPIDIKYQIVDNEELIQRLFVNEEVKKSINCILDYDKYKFTPIDDNNNEILTVTYKINLLNQQKNNYIQNTSLIDLGISNSDLENNSFKSGFFYLKFYDSYNPQTKNFLTESQIFNVLNTKTAFDKGIIKPTTQIPIEYVSSNPKIFNSGIYTAFYVYDDMDNYQNNESKNSLYATAHLFNAKTGKIIDFIMTNELLTIDKIPENQHLKFNLERKGSKFVYKIDTSFSKNVSYQQSGNRKNIVINFYETRVK